MGANIISKDEYNNGERRGIERRISDLEKQVEVMKAIAKRDAEAQEKIISGIENIASTLTEMKIAMARDVAGLQRDVGAMQRDLQLRSEQSEARWDTIEETIKPAAARDTVG